MNRIIGIQKRSSQYVKKLADNVIKVVESNSETMIDMNRSNMLSSLTANDTPLMPSPLSKQYAKRTGKTRPNLFLTGDFQEGMFLTMPTEKEYIITSDDPKVNFLTERYGKIFGVSPKNQPKAQSINTAAIINDYLKIVFN